MQRILELSGVDTIQERLKLFESHKNKVLESFNKEIYKIKNYQNSQLDESIFTSLKSALTSVLNIDKSVNNHKIKQLIDKIEPNVKTLYKSEKGKTELNQVIDFIKDNIANFDNLFNKCNNLLQIDKEFNKEVVQFKELYIQLVLMLGARQAITEGVDNNDLNLKYMLVEMGYIEEPPVLLTEAKNYKFLSIVKDTEEFLELQKRMVLCSTETQLCNGVFVFDTKMSGLNIDGSKNLKSTFLLKVYPDGQIKGELKNGKAVMKNLTTNWLLGKPINDNDKLLNYKKAFVNLIQRYEKKKIRYEKEQEILVKKYNELNNLFIAANIDRDAVIE